MKCFDGLGIDKVFFVVNQTFYKNVDGKIYGTGFISWWKLFMDSEPCNNVFFKPIETNVNDVAFITFDWNNATVLFKNCISSNVTNNKKAFKTKTTPTPSKIFEILDIDEII